MDAGLRVVTPDGLLADHREATTEDFLRPYRKNVRRLFTMCFFQLSSAAVALGPLFDAYLLNVGGKNGNVLVGAVESTRGMLQLCFAYPIGWASDRIPRVRLLKYSLPFYTLGFCMVLCGVFWNSIALIVLGIVVYAPCSQCLNSCSQMLLADWLPPDVRTASMANLSTTKLLAMSLGPLFQVMLLLALGKDHWGNTLLRWVICSGLFLFPGVIVWTLKLVELQPLEKSGGQSGVNCKASMFDEEDLDRTIYGVKLRWWLAVTLELSTFLTYIGGGMTVKFFPLFFRIDYGFTPMQVCLLSWVCPVFVAGMVQVLSRASKRVGRLEAVFWSHVLGTGCLWLLCMSHSLYLVLPLYLLRGALMSTGPIKRAIIMDVVPSETRGRWNSIQSISGFSWSGSAALGGYIADNAGDYRFTFVIAASIYSFAALCLLPLFLIYPEESKGAREVGPLQETAGASTPSVIATQAVLARAQHESQIEVARVDADRVEGDVSLQPLERPRSTT